MAKSYRVYVRRGTLPGKTSFRSLNCSRLDYVEMTDVADYGRFLVGKVMIDGKPQSISINVDRITCLESLDDNGG